MPADRVYLLRSCDHDFTGRDHFAYCRNYYQAKGINIEDIAFDDVAWDSKDVFRWPSEVGAELQAKKWTRDLSCGEGDGLHGFLGGEGDASFANWSDDAQWLVFSAPVREVIAIQAMAKARSARIEHVGRGRTGADRLRDCLDYLASIGRLAPFAMGITREGDKGCRLTGGARSNLTGGDYCTLVAGDNSILRGGDNSILVGGRCSRLTAGDRSDLTAGRDSHLTGGKDCRLIGGAGSVITSGDRCRLSAGAGSRLKGGDSCSLAAGADSHLTGGHGCRLEAGSGSSVLGRSGCSITGGSGSRLVGDDNCDIMGGDRCTVAGGHRSHLVGGAHCRISSGSYSVLVGGFGSRLMGGRESVLTFKWQDDPKHPHLTILSAVVGADGIEPGVYYTVRDGAIVPAEDGVRRRVPDCDVGYAEIWELMQRHR